MTTGTFTSNATDFARGNPLELVDGPELMRLIGALPTNAQARLVANLQDARQVSLPSGSVILAADESFVARNQIEKVLQAIGAPYLMTKTGKEAWEKLQAVAQEAKAVGRSAQDRVVVVLTDLETPEMGGFTLTKTIKADERFKNIPVVIHSSLTGQANVDHARNVGAEELGDAIQRVVGPRAQPTP